jgi:hypothetical protein
MKAGEGPAEVGAVGGGLVVTGILTRNKVLVVVGLVLLLLAGMWWLISSGVIPLSLP